MAREPAGSGWTWSAAAARFRAGRARAGGARGAGARWAVPTRWTPVAL